ncbi:hypothetical protein PR048_013773 [Dryococelus australis]|uniref:Uncharacterized protein n=1 Tax=Dryococelus australis TaxID=614101 RepID=A0ABQ9HTJ8_9NEOP|nr:hypothetical protein PR048_013773 [Dryococelus australis]
MAGDLPHSPIGPDGKLVQEAQVPLVNQIFTTNPWFLCVLVEVNGTLMNTLINTGTSHDIALGQQWLIDQDTELELGATRIHIGKQEQQTIYATGAIPPTPGNSMQLTDFQHGMPQSHQAAVQLLIDERRAVFIATNTLMMVAMH